MKKPKKPNQPKYRTTNKMNQEVKNMGKNKRIMNHHKRNHNGNRRTRKDDPARSNSNTYFRSCGCEPKSVEARNKTIALAVSKCKPSFEWNDRTQSWIAHVPKHITRRFGRCMQHFDIEKISSVARHAAAAA
jgi:hypothetical protein